MLRKLLALVIATLSVACVSTPQPDAVYPDQIDPTLKPNLAFTLDGVPCQGAVVAPRKLSTKIGINLPAETKTVIVSSCGRFKDFWDPDLKKTWYYSYEPTMDTEKFKTCPSYLTAVTTKGEWHRGIIDWSNSPAYPAKADTTCDGETRLDRVGNDICSIMAGIPVVINSPIPAVIARDPDSTCPDPVEKTHLRSWEIPTRAPKAKEAALCVYVMKNKNKEEFRLTIHTYTSIMRVFPPKK